MSLGQAQLVKWSLPALALILGLFWYKRRRVDRVDPGGSGLKALAADEGVSKESPAAELTARQATSESRLPNEARPAAGKHCDSGINSDESLNASSSSPSKDQPLAGSLTPRKVSISLDIPGRSSVQSTAAFSSTPWYDEVDEDDDEEEAELRKRSPIEMLGSHPAKEHTDLLSKSQSSAELIANGNTMKENRNEQKRQQKQAKVVVAKGTPRVQKFQVKEDVVQSPEVQAAPQPAEKNEPLDGGHQLSNGEAGGDEKKQDTQALLERDSANHSPVSGVLDGSVTDEARSEGEGSTDSGKGGSINGGQGKENNRTFYEFSIPTRLVGKLIGKGGRFLEHIRKKANVGVVVKRHPTNDEDCRICSIDGTPENISSALIIIRRYFPEKAYPYLSLEQIIYDELIVPDEVAWMPELIQLQLVEGVNNDVVICYIDKPNHLFIHLPTHPTYPSLRLLTERMTQEYDTVESPAVPDQLSRGMILVGKLYSQWVRVFVENPDPNGEQTLVRLVDHGGYWTLNHAEMRKIRADYLGLPFQAIEVYLDIQPKDGEWTPEAYDIVSQLSTNSVGQAQVTGYTDCNPYINLYYNIQRVGYISVTEELKARGLAVPALPVIPTSIPEQVVSQEALPAV